MKSRISVYILAAIGITAALAQRTTQLTGRISDSTDAVIEGAEVVVTNQDTGIRRETKSNELGYFVVPLLQPGRYEVAVQKAGFRPIRRSGITLEVDQAARVDFVLEVGSLTESVQVSANVATVDTQSATLKEVIDERRIRELPLNGRDATQLVLLMPGVYGTVRDNSGLRQAGSGRGIVQAGVASNGARGNMVNYMLDGTTHNDTYTNVALAFPDPDALQEFSVQTNNFSAESGRSAGAVVTAVTKSGTNSLHGSLFEFHRNGAINARNFFAPKPDGLKRNQFGGTLGGPIWRDHTFFFFSHQETRQRSTPSDSSTTVLTQAQRNGDFSAFSGNITDPANGQPFAQKQIPVSRMNSLTKTILDKLIPLPTEARTGLLRYSVPNSSDLRQTTVKVDHQLGSKDTLSGRYLYNYYFEPSNDTPLVFATRSKRTTPNHNAEVTETHIFSPSLINQAQFSITRREDVGQPVWTTGYADLGMKNVVTNTPTKDFNLSVTGAFSVSVTEAIVTKPNAYTIADTLRFTRGRHEMSMGFEYRKQSLDKNFRWLLDPAMSFDGSITGSGVADFFIGKPSLLDELAYGEVGKQDFPVYIAFFQNNIKVTPKLTVNVGIRYEPSIPYKDVGGRVSVFRPGLKSQVFVNAPTGLLYVGDPGVPERGTKSDLNNFAPRVGFAWAPVKRTSVRAAYGIFYDSSPMSAITNVFQGVAPFGTRLRVRPPVGPFDDPFLGKNPFPLPFPPPKDITFPLGVAAATWPERYRTGYLQSWHLTIERELFPDWLLRVAYAGSKGTKLLSGLEVNPPIYIPGQSTALNISQRRPYGPALDTIRLVNSDGSSSYNSLQLTLDKRFSKGLTVQANYTWAKSIDFGSGGGTQWPSLTPGDYGYDRGLSDFHHKHRFVTSGLWELPALAGKPALMKWVLGGWQPSGSLILQSAAAFSVQAGRENSLTTFGNRARQVGDPSRSARTDPNRDRVLEWFNTKAFDHAPTGTYGNSGRNIVFGPGLASVDFSMAKYFPVTERFKVQFRSEFFNLLNHTNLNEPNSTLTAGTYGRITSALDPRILQFGLKLLF